MVHAIGWLTVTIAVAIVAAQLAFFIQLGNLRLRFPPSASASIASAVALKPQSQALFVQR